MSGCATCIFVAFKPDTFCSKLHDGAPNSFPVHRDLFAQYAARKTALETFGRDTELKRHGIVQQYARLREAISSSEREALATIDTVIKQQLKSLQAGCDALQIQIWQAATGLTVCHLEQQNEPLVNSLPSFRVVGMEALQSMIHANQCLALAYSDDNEEVMLTESHVLQNMCDFITTASHDLSSLAVSKCFETPKRKLFRDQRVSRRKLDALDTVNIVAVSPDGKLVAAVAWPDRSRIRLISVEEGKLMWEIGSYGSLCGQFACIRSLCFTASGENILVAESGNRRIQELTLRGGPVRQITMDPGLCFYRIRSNSKVIVTCGFYDYGICVTDYATAVKHSWENTIGPPKKFLDLSLSFCGTRIACLEQSSNCISVFSLQGQLFHHFLPVGITIPHAVGFMLSGEICVYGQQSSDKHWEAFVFSKDGSHGKRSSIMFDKFEPAKFEPAQISCINDFFFVLQPFKLEIWW